MSDLRPKADPNGRPISGGAAASGGSGGTGGAAYKSLHRGLEILQLIQGRGRLKISEISSELGMPLSTVYRYVTVLRDAGFAIEIDGYLMPSSRLAESDDASPHLVRYAAPVLRRLRELTGMTAILAVRVHITAVCLEVSYAHPQHRIPFGRGKVRSLYAGATALPLLAYAPKKVVRELLSGGLRAYTTATMSPEMIEPYLRQVRAEGHAVSYGQITPGMVGIGVPVFAGGRVLCSLSLVGDERQTGVLDERVALLKQGAAELAAKLPSNVDLEVWSDQSA
ncbi:hypothetical protein C5E10_15500 [Pseudoclavibacter sp. RFBG4]|uniref:IclR family transcriptional regulator n=1 Tax=Pseudoclavibacter sp. RFBG4 TaxID=2080575 RepID=UPI000CE859E6|nr:IclR family transcriptional regulator [Pseudoclavibacter sp. RFBG4]PPG27251.1 hypothetical protein C5E10_15500 [Pseudoclavibacter sp. RFBG4]